MLENKIRKCFKFNYLGHLKVFQLQKENTRNFWFYFLLLSISAG